MGVLSKIFSSGAREILEEGGNIVDNLTTSDAEKSEAKNKLTETVFDALNKIKYAQRDIIISETQGSKLQRSWRPIVMLSFAFIVVYSYFIQPAFFPNSISMIDKIDPSFWELLKLGIGGYVIGRSVEKVASKVTENVDMPFLKKKNR